MALLVHHSCRKFCDQWKRDSRLPPSAGSIWFHPHRFTASTSVLSLPNLRESVSHITRYLHMFVQIRWLSICSCAILMRSRLKIAIVLEFGTPSNDVAIRLKSTVWVIYTFRIFRKQTSLFHVVSFVVQVSWVLISRHRLADSFSRRPSLHVLYLKSKEKKQFETLGYVPRMFKHICMSVTPQLVTDIPMWMQCSFPITEIKWASIRYC